MFVAHAKRKGLNTLEFQKNHKVLLEDVVYNFICGVLNCVGLISCHGDFLQLQSNEYMNLLHPLGVKLGSCKIGELSSGGPRRVGNETGGPKTSAIFLSYLWPSCAFLTLAQSSWFSSHFLQKLLNCALKER